MRPRRILILGAAGRDFHNFNTVYRHDPSHRVIAFTATQIPGIEGRLYPASLAGPLYPDGIPILSESELSGLIRERKIDLCVFSYSDVSYAQVMHLASVCVSEGADFALLGADRTMIDSTVPVIAVTAVRTGAGKSQTTRYLSRIIKSLNLRVVVVRHPMPYGDLPRQAVQRFASSADLSAEKCTIEEREEYEPHIENGFVVYAGVDYERILRAAEREADVILWDGGNNDLPFFQPSLHICVADPHRAGDELAFWPGEANFRRAGVIIINKCDTAEAANVRSVEQSAASINPRAAVILAESPLSLDHADLIRGRRVLVIEDGPTLTHGGMSYGAGLLAARRAGPREIIDPRPYAVGSIRETYEKYPNAAGILPAMGYGDQQIRELEETIRRTPAEVVVVGTPIDLTQILKLDRPSVRVRYELREIVPGRLEAIVRAALQGRQRPPEEVLLSSVSGPGDDGTARQLSREA